MHTFKEIFLRRDENDACLQADMDSSVQMTRTDSLLGPAVTKYFKKLC